MDPGGEQAEQFDLIGNSAVVWKNSACDLLFSAKVLAEAEARQLAEARSDESKVPFLRCFWPRIMLRAFAFECLATAIKIQKGQIVYSKGKLQKSKDHRLTTMLADAGISLSSDDKNLLDRMTAVAVAHGRFPLPTHPSRFQEFQPDQTGQFHVAWATPRDEQSYLRLLGELMDQSGFSEFEKNFFQA